MQKFQESGEIKSKIDLSNVYRLLSMCQTT